MNFRIKSRQLKGLEEIEAKITQKAQRFTTILPAASYLELELIHHSRVHTTGNKHAEVILDLPGRRRAIRFAAHGPTFLEAVDRVLDKLDHALGREKHRRDDHSLHHRRPPKEELADLVNRGRR